MGNWVKDGKSWKLGLGGRPLASHMCKLSVQYPALQKQRPNQIKKQIEPNKPNTWKTTSPKTVYRWQAHEKTLSLSLGSYQWKQSWNRVPFITRLLRWSTLKIQMAPNTEAGAAGTWYTGQKTPLPPGKRVGQFLRKPNISLPHDPIITLLHVYPDKCLWQLHSFEHRHNCVFL